MGGDLAAQPTGTGEASATDRLFAGDSEMAALARAFDWSGTPLGPVDGWSQSLRTIVYVLLTSPHPMFLWWGPELVQLYNDGYRPSLGEDRHPAALGARGREFWGEIWSIIGPEVEAVMQGGESTWHEDHLVPIARNARMEEVYWTYSYSPVLDDDGGIGGTLVTVHGTTSRVLKERRMAILRVVAESTTAQARAVAGGDSLTARPPHQEEGDGALARAFP